MFKIKIQPTISKQEKKRQRIYDLLNAETKPKFPCLQNKEKNLFFFFFFFTAKEFFKEKKGVDDWTKKWKEFFTSSRYGDSEGPHIVNKKAR